MAKEHFTKELWVDGSGELMAANTSSAPNAGAFCRVGVVANVWTQLLLLRSSLEVVNDLSNGGRCIETIRRAREGFRP